NWATPDERDQPDEAGKGLTCHWIPAIGRFCQRRQFPTLRAFRKLRAKPHKKTLIAYWPTLSRQRSEAWTQVSTGSNFTVRMVTCCRALSLRLQISAPISSAARSRIAATIPSQYSKPCAKFGPPKSP